MARPPRKEAVKPETPRPWADYWIEDADIAEAIANGLRGDALADHLEQVAGGRYMLACRDAPKGLTFTPPRGAVSLVRPVVDRSVPPTRAALEVEADRHYRFTRRCRFVDRESFLRQIGGEG